MLYSTRKSTKRKAEFWKGSKTYTVSPNGVWMRILKSDQPLNNWKKKKKSFNWALCSKEMFHPFHPIVHWLHECKSFGYNSQSICEDQTILMLLNHIIWKYLFWNLKIPNTPSLHFFLTESVALGLCRYFFMTSVWLQCQEILRSS